MNACQHESVFQVTVTLLLPSIPRVLLNISLSSFVMYSGSTVILSERIAIFHIFFSTFIPQMGANWVWKKYQLYNPRELVACANLSPLRGRSADLS